MDTFRFLDFKVYQDAKAFEKKVFVITKNFPRDYEFSLITQIRRNTLSVVLNIAEGSAKKSDREFAKYLEIAIASLNEAVASLDVALNHALISIEQFSELKFESAEIANQLGGFLKKLRKS